MNPKILNREFQHPADGWYQIEPQGEHPNRSAGVVQIIDDEAKTSIVNRFNADAEAGKLSHGSEMLIDHEHFKHDRSKETIAYGWLQKLANRADGIYAQIRWTATGKTAVDGGDYRFFSTEYDAADLKVLNASSPIRRIRPMRLDGLTLTNDPNNKGGRPITNRGSSGASPHQNTFATARAAAGNQTDNQQPRNTMKSVCTLLGLSAEADETSVHAAVTKLQNRATTLESEVTPLKNRVGELESANTTLLDEQIAADFATAKITDEKIINRHTPLLRDAKHFKNRAERLAFIQDLAKPATTTANTRVLNRADGKPNTDTQPADEAALAQKAEAEITSYKLTNRCSYADARNAVRAQKPELFGLAKN